MILSVALATISLASDFNILFLGNSHTASNALPAMVKGILKTSASKPEVSVRAEIGGFLDDLAQRKEVLDLIRSKRYTHLVLQGQKLSSSHKYEYSKDAAIALAKLGKSAGLKVLLFAEWSRRGVSESAFQINGYRPIAKATGATIVPVCNAFDFALSKDKTLNLWAGDGNHASVIGTYLAACTIANAMSPIGESPRLAPQGCDKATSKLLWSSALRVVLIR